MEEKNNNLNILKFLYIIIVIFSLWTEKMGVIAYRWYTQYILGILFILFYIVSQPRMVIKISKTEKNIIYMLVIPNFIIMIYSMIIMNMQKIELFEGSFSRTVGLFVYLLVAILVGYLSFKSFGKKAIDYTFYGFVANYIINIFLQVVRYGIGSIVLYLINPTTTVGTLLEAHELSLTMPLFLIYYFIIYKEKKMFKIIICIIISVLAQKRTVFLDVIVVLSYYYIVKGIKNKKAVLNITGIITIFICFGYVYIIKSGVLWDFLSQHWINLMGRQYIWKGIDSTYIFDVSFLGRGSGFTTKWLQNYTYTLGFIGLDSNIVIGGLHNDILRAFIEYGFLGCFIYLYNYIILNYKRIAKWISMQSAIIYMIIILAQIILWFTDNVANYYNFQIVFSMIVFNLINVSNVKQNKDGENNVLYKKVSKFN